AQFASLSPSARLRTLTALIPLLTAPESATVHALLAPPRKRDFLSDLPPELALAVLARLDDPRALCAAQAVSTAWRTLARDDAVWRAMCERQHIAWPEPDDSPFEPDRAPRTWRALFKYYHTTHRNWRTRGTLLRAQRLATPATDPALSTITSSALSRSLLVAGLADARIHIFAAHSGEHVRTLVGHESGVWAVALVASGGALDPRHRARALDAAESAPALGAAESARALDAAESARAESAPLEAPRSAAAIQSHNRAPAGARTADAPHLAHLLPPSLRRALALDAPPRWMDAPASGRADVCGASRGWGQPGSLVVSSGSDKTVRVWDADTGICLYVLRGHASTVRTLRVVHNRPIAVSGARDGAMRVWDIQRGALLRVLTGHTASVRALEICGTEVVSGSYDRTCRLWNIDTGDCLQIFRGHVAQIYCVAYDGARVASGGIDTVVRVWDARDGACVAQLQTHTALVCQLQLSPSLLVSGGADGRRVRVHIAQRIIAHDSSITALQLVCDGRLLATSGNDGRARLWDVARGGRFVRELVDAADGVWGLVFRAEGGAVMCRRAGRMVVEIWRFGGEGGGVREAGEEEGENEGGGGGGSFGMETTPG
ncbi:WD40-repeat-containing domain protein, partial [Vararia minispora EC-137]